MRTAATVLWESYRHRVFGDEPLPLMQERECSLAFYAGIEGAFKMLEKISAFNVSDEESSKLLEQFRQESAKAANLANLDRATGTS